MYAVVQQTDDKLVITFYKSGFAFILEDTAFVNAKGLAYCDHIYDSGYVTCAWWCGTKIHAYIQK